ncbi:MAG TPA: MarR family transcriptional regulator [Limosilactobacillus coleohominis]|nr:MarR family transcriptional regulator [Limosilactobacillus coleohominis]
MKIDKFERTVHLYNNLIRSYIRHKLVDYDLNENNYYYVLIICEKHEMTQTELNQIVYRQQSIITKAVQFLEKNDWLTVDIDVNDRRRRIIKPTEKAINNYDALKRIVDDATQYARKGLSDDEFAQLNSLITKAVHAMDDQYL